MAINLEKFHGADLQRFIKCIVAIDKEGIQAGEYTQAGINPNSGNVWLWDEDWPGSVYVGPGSEKPRWCWSCPECGEEYIFDTYEEITEHAEKYSDGKCEACATEE